MTLPSQSLVEAQFALQEAVRWIEKAGDLIVAAGHAEHGDLYHSIYSVDVDRKVVQRLIEDEAPTAALTEREASDG